MSSRDKLPRSTPPHLAAAFLLPQLHHSICWQAYHLNQMSLRGLPPQDYESRSFNLSWVLDFEDKRRSQGAAKLPRPRAKVTGARPTVAPLASDLCESMTRACVLCVIHTGKNIQKV